MRDDSRASRLWAWRLFTLISVGLAAMCLLGGCAAMETIRDALPATQGQLSDVEAGAQQMLDGAATGNWIRFGVGLLAVVGAVVGGRKSMRTAMERYDEAAYEGNDGETATEAEIVTAARTIVDRTPPVQ